MVTTWWFPAQDVCTDGLCTKSRRRRNGRIRAQRCVRREEEGARYPIVASLPLPPLDTWESLIFEWALFKVMYCLLAHTIPHLGRRRTRLFIVCNHKWAVKSTSFSHYSAEDKGGQRVDGSYTGRDEITEIYSHPVHPTFRSLSAKCKRGHNSSRWWWVVCCW